ncbi:hypothetical protein D3C86_1862720 [compost metagenome]
MGFVTCCIQHQVHVVTYYATIKCNGYCMDITTACLGNVCCIYLAGIAAVVLYFVIFNKGIFGNYQFHHFIIKTI